MKGIRFALHPFTPRFQVDAVLGKVSILEDIPPGWPISIETVYVPGAPSLHVHVWGTKVMCFPPTLRVQVHDALCILWRRFTRKPAVAKDGE